MWQAVFLLLLPSLALSKVAFLIELCRHGSRSPLSFQAWDEDGRWPDGAGQLTPAGMRQHYLIGMTLRTRYQDLFRRNYTHSEFRVVSTDVDRTIMSAESQLLGLFPANPSYVTTEQAVPPLQADFSDANLGQSSLPNAFQPVPIHMTVGSSDLVLNPQQGACRKLEEMDKGVFRSEEANKILSRYSDLLSTLQRALHQNLTYVTEHIEDILDSLTSSRFEGHPLPLTEEDITAASSLQNELFSLPYRSEKAVKMWMSGFFHELQRHLEAFSNGTEPAVFLLYSAHDTTIAAALRGLEAYDNIQPPFASTLLFEVSDNKSLRVLYNDKALNIGECGGAQCEVTQFCAYLRSRMTENLEKDCGNEERSGEERLEAHLGHWLAWFMLSILIMGLFSAVSAVFASFVVSKRHLHLVEAQDIEAEQHSGR